MAWQRLRRVEVLHPDRRAVAERVDRVVFIPRVVAHHSTPSSRRCRRAWQRSLPAPPESRRSATTPLVAPRTTRHVPAARASPPAEQSPGQPDRDAVRGDREQHARPLEARHLRERSGQLDGLEERPDGKDCRRAAVQDDPIVDAFGVQEVDPPLFAHGVGMYCPAQLGVTTITRLAPWAEEGVAPLEHPTFHGPRHLGSRDGAVAHGWRFRRSPSRAGAITRYCAPCNGCPPALTEGRRRLGLDRRPRGSSCSHPSARASASSAPASSRAGSRGGSGTGRTSEPPPTC